MISYWLFTISRFFIRLFRRDIQTRYPQYKIGRATYGNPTIYTWGEGAHIEIGAYCSFASGVKIFLGGNHRIDWVTTYPFSVFNVSARKIPGHPQSKGNIYIGNDVWIGRDAVILSGITIGDGAVIGTQAVVTRDVPPYAIVAGNPAKLIRMRFSDEVIKNLLEIKWWDWDEQKIEKFIPLLLSDDINLFIEQAQKDSPSIN
jgi:chloramphenicol O-acetyltransferase type B